MPKVMKTLSAICLLAFFLAFVNVSLVRAQSEMIGKLSGTITDDKGEPLPGVTVEVTSPSMMGRRSALTTAKGTYVFLQLPPGKFKLVASMPNFKTTVQENITVGAGDSLVVNVAMEIGAIEETVTVTAAGPIVDAKTSGVGTKLDQDMLAKLPTSRDAFYDLAITTPGMFDAGGNAGWMPSPTAYGAAQNENVFLVNGVNTTNPRGANWGSMVHVNYNAVEEVRVMALGTKAEYGNVSGAIVDVLTRSGSNSFHGSVAGYTQLATPPDNQPAPGEDLGRDWIYIPEGTQYANRTHEDWEANLTIGGPILKDKVWFYGGFDYLKSRTDTPQWPLLTGWWGRYFDAKISAEPWLNHRAWIAYHYENNDLDNQNWGSWAEPTANYFTGSKINSVSAQWQWLPSSNVILTAKYLGFWTRDTQGIPDPEEGGPTWPEYTNWWKLGLYQVNGRFPWIEMMPSNRNTVQADLSYYAEDFLGEHDIKFGAQYTKGSGDYEMGYFQGYANFAYPQGYNYYIPNLINYSWYAFTDGMQFRNEQRYINPHLTARRGTQFGLFFDDQWTPTSRLTVNLGLRYDSMQAHYGEGKVYEVPATPNQINDPPPVLRTRAATDNVFDFNTISPRIGLTYMLTRDGKTVARASYGRYYMPITLENLRRYGPDMDPLTNEQYLYKIPWDQFDMNQNNYVDADEVAYWTPRLRDLTPFSHETIITDQSWQLFTNPDLKDQFTDQVTLNIEREIIRDFSVSATYIYRHTGNLMAQIPVNGTTGLEWEYEMKPYTTSNGTQVELYSVVKKDYDGWGDGFTGHDVQWINDANNQEVRNVGEYFGKNAERNYSALQLVFNKRYSNRWQGLASVVYSSSRGTAARTIHQMYNVEGMMITDDIWMSSLNQLLNNMDGPLPFTPKWEVKIFGSYKIPSIDVDLGLRFRFNTGRPVWQIETFGNLAATWMGAVPDSMVVQPNSGGLSAQILSGTSENPEYLPSLTQVDFRVEKAFRVSKYGSLNVALDCFNLFNSGTINSVYPGPWNYGEVFGLISPPLKFRLSVAFQF